MDNIYIVTEFAEKGDLSVVSFLFYLGNPKQNQKREEIYGGIVMANILEFGFCGKVFA